MASHAILDSRREHRCSVRRTCAASRSRRRSVAPSSCVRREWRSSLSSTWTAVIDRS
jgi:hypothetical protein